MAETTNNQGASQTQQAASQATDSTGVGIQTAQTQQEAVIDYDKIAQIVSGKQSEAEDKVLRGYFKQQGLSQQDAEQAMADFKQKRAASQPDVNALQGQITAAQQAQQAAQAAALQAQVQAAATMAAVSLGIAPATIPYVLKMADLGQVMGQDGKINDETMKAALNKVLEDVPALKPQASSTTGFIQVGASSGGQAQQTVDTELDRIFGVKKK